MSEALVCWRCGAPVTDLPQPLSRLAECTACRAELHVCRMCVFYDPRVSQSCAEPVADEVADKERANFCGYFEAKPGAYKPREVQAQASARAQLEALFGKGSQAEASGSGTEDTARRALEELFGSGKS